MLYSIFCEKFIEKTIVFDNGLNAVVGDNNGSNSIGKSTFLMIIDFAFGGDTYIDWNKDVVEHIGNHEIIIEFHFGNKKYRYLRNTENSKSVFELLHKEEKKELSIDQYKKRLAKLYGLNGITATFRQIVSTYSRVWGKQNYDVFNPLLDYPKQGNKDAVTILMEIYEKYDEIAKIDEIILKNETSKKVLTQAFSQKYINKINKTKYLKNKDALIEKNKEIKSIQKNLKLFALNVREVSDRNILKKKNEKDNLLAIKAVLENRISRIGNSINKEKVISEKQLVKLKEFFPEAGIKKLSEIENFHKGITKILEKQLKQEIEELNNELIEVNDALSDIDKELSKKLNHLNNPSEIIERVVAISNEINQMQIDNQFYEKMNTLGDELEEKKEELVKRRDAVLCDLEKNINSSLQKLSKQIQGEYKKPPKIMFENGMYKYLTHDDTGTGKAYIDLLLLDLTVIDQTKLPFIIHDSLLFKNLSISTTKKLFEKYITINKQIFIAIDELAKYPKEFIDLVNGKKKLELSGEKLLFGIDWSNKERKKK